MGQEKRQSARIKGDFGILCKIYKKIDLESTLSHIYDISGRGVSFMLDSPLEKDNLLQMTFRIPPDFKERIDIFGQIIQSEKQGKGFRIRVAFIDMDERTKTILSRIAQQTTLK